MSLSDLLGADQFNVLPHLAAILSAYLLALPIGWNREKAERSAGLRTFPLVAVASCGFVQATEGMTATSPEAMSRIIEGVIVGIGFIGGGAILQLKRTVKGTATAASLWVTGAIGVAVGLGSLDLAVMLTVITFFTLFTLSPLKQAVEDEKKDEPERHDPDEADV